MKSKSMENWLKLFAKFIFLAEFIYLAEVIFSQHNLVLIYKFMYLFNWI